MLQTHIGGVEIKALARDFGTPVFVYDRAIIEQRIADLKGFPVIRFAQKACSNIAILSLMRKRGVVVDAVSAGEIHRALKAGFKPDDVVYTADIFDRASLELIVEHRMPVNCGSLDMIAQYGERCPGREITLRINPGFGHGHSQKTNTGGEGSKHGIWHELIDECLAAAKKYSLKVTGLHLHIGSGSDFEHLAQVGNALIKIASRLPDLTHISGGGGLPTPYRPADKPLDIGAFTKLWLDTQARMEKQLGRKIKLEVEPGRYLVAEAGNLITEVRAVKKQGTYTYALLDAGFNNLARPVMYGSYHPISVCPQGAAPSETQDVVVGGRLCESGDIFTQAEGGYVETRKLPKMQVGDLLTLHCAGAYGFVMGSNYNTMPLAPEVLVSNGKPILIRERQTAEDLLRGEHIPADL
ncbi:MAG: diaminopimelate decarboxylase [Planctomycetota bacterium]|nr:diaminopimelate decarboxylase [Planctomycetota bacterium]